MVTKEQDGAVEVIGPQATILRRWIVDEAPLLRAIDHVRRGAPFRRMMTPGGRAMSVAMTNCGSLGWVSDRHGYRYAPNDPQSGRPWPAMPRCLADAARGAAEAAGFAEFVPDACLINRYEPRARLSLHQDRDERDFSAPIVSISLGLPATFLFGGPRRAVRPARYRLEHGDVVVWGGESRLFFHGIAPLRAGTHDTLGARRINLTLRKAR